MFKYDPAPHKGKLLITDRKATFHFTYNMDNAKMFNNTHLINAIDEIPEQFSTNSKHLQGNYVINIFSSFLTE
jgi:hypothetical protein